MRETSLQVREPTKCVRIQKSRKEALSPKENTKQTGLLKKVNSFQGNTTRLPPSLSSSPCKSWGGGCSPGVRPTQHPGHDLAGVSKKVPSALHPRVQYQAEGKQMKG